MCEDGPIPSREELENFMSYAAAEAGRETEKSWFLRVYGYLERLAKTLPKENE